MYKIQQTSIVDTSDTEAIIELTIGDHEEIDECSEFVVASVNVERPIQQAHYLKLQLRALGKAADLIEQVAAAVELKLPKN